MDKLRLKRRVIQLFPLSFRFMYMRKTNILLSLLCYSFAMMAQITPKSVSTGIGGFFQFDDGKKNYYHSNSFGVYSSTQYHINSHFSIGANFEYTQYNTQKDFQFPDTLLWTRVTEKQKARRFAIFSRYYHKIGSPKWQAFVQGSMLFYNQFGAAKQQDTGEFIYPLSGLIEVGFDIIPGIQYMPRPHWSIEATAGRLYLVSGLKGLNSYDHQGFSVMPAKIGINYFIF